MHLKEDLLKYVKLKKPIIGEEDVLLEVENVGVCGSDLHQWIQTIAGR
jgi:alcohol dehydrogenase/L-iditol 2-dehydrogenase